MRSFNAIFFFLLLYIIAALTFWWISLTKQSTTIANNDIEVLALKKALHGNKSEYDREMEIILKREQTREKQYIGEGLTFLIVTLAGALIVYRSARKTLQLSAQQNNFMLAVTHELKTPLAGIKLSLQTLQKRQLDEPTRSTILEKSVQEVNRLNDLCSNILVASQMDAKQYKVVKVPMNFTNLVAECCASFEALEQVVLQQNLQPNVFLTGDHFSLQMAISNVISNALKYSNYAPVAVTLVEKNSLIVLTISDQGIGIPETEKRKVFEKFYRVGAENTRKKKGTGLGLFLTQKIIKQHQGTINIYPNEPQGTSIVICL